MHTEAAVSTSPTLPAMASSLTAAAEYMYPNDEVGLQLFSTWHR